MWNPFKRRAKTEKYVRAKRAGTVTDVWYRLVFINDKAYAVTKPLVRVGEKVAPNQILGKI